MSKSRIPALNKGLGNVSNRKTDQQTVPSSSLFHYGFTVQDQKSARKDSNIKIKAKGLNEKDTNLETATVMKRSSKEDLLSEKTRKTEKGPGTLNNRVGEVNSLNRPPAHLSLSQTQLNALSYSLSELADKISPTKNEFQVDWELKATAETIGDESSTVLSWSKTDKHSKTPYSRKHEPKHPLSKQKSFDKKSKTRSEESKLQLINEDKSVQSETHVNEISNETGGNSESSLKPGSPVHQESVESGYNSSWSTSSASWSEDLKDGGNRNNADGDTDIEQDLPLPSDTLTNNDTKISKKQGNNGTLQTQISDVEKRINCLILGRRLSRAENRTMDSRLQDNPSENGKKVEKDARTSDCGTKSNDSNSKAIPEGDTIKIEDEETQDVKPEVDENQNNHTDSSKTTDNTTNIDNDLRKSPFHVLKVKKTSLEDASTTPKSKRPGLVRRRTTLTFRPPRKSGFAEADDGDVLEIDEAGFVQCLTDVRAMKTMLLKLKRELQEAEVHSPLGRTLSALSRNVANLTNTSSVNETSEEGGRRNTYDSSEMIHEKLRQIRTKSLSRTKQSNVAESPSENQSADTPDVVTSAQALSGFTGKRSNDDETKKMRQELEELRESMKTLKRERDTILTDKEEIEHELETKNHTIKMLQKQLEAQENSDEVTFLQRQVTTLTHQVRQQQQKIAELKYRSAAPKKESVKIDIKNRLRDAFTRHLEETSKSHLLLSKHIEKAEFTISEAQKGLKSLCITSTSSHTSSKESLTISGNDACPRKHTRSSSLTGLSFSKEDMRRHSWAPNSIEKIIKSWKETTQSIENLSSKTPTSSQKSSRLPQLSENAPSSSHYSFL